MENLIEKIPPNEKLSIENIGWTLGNDCPYRCNQCYSLTARLKGKDLESKHVDRIVDQLSINKIKTVNLGGNEPIFTNGLDVKKTKLPYIIKSLVDKNILVGLTTAGVTLQHLIRYYGDYFLLLNDVDVSIDSPFKWEHDKNRGAQLFDSAIWVANMCQAQGIEHTLVMCGMNWNLSESHLQGLINLAKATGSNLRINYLKPIEEKHLDIFPSARQYYESAQYLIDRCSIVDLGEPLLSSVYSDLEKGCPCGTKSFRIHSITPDGKVPVSPCVYMHDYRYGDLLKDDLIDIINSNQFKAFRQRRSNPANIPGCNCCEHLNSCRGGCAARSSLFHKNKNILEVKDPYCLKDYTETIVGSSLISDVNFGQKSLVHRDYLCTLILSPK
ncbi:MAG: radical SAM protein [Patescibacteria group bacterium]